MQAQYTNGYRKLSASERANDFTLRLLHTTISRWFDALQSSIHNTMCYDINELSKRCVSEMRMWMYWCRNRFIWFSFLHTAQQEWEWEWEYISEWKRQKLVEMKFCLCAVLKSNRNRATVLWNSEATAVYHTYKVFSSERIAVFVDHRQFQKK